MKKRQLTTYSNTGERLCKLWYIYSNYLFQRHHWRDARESIVVSAILNLRREHVLQDQKEVRINLSRVDFFITIKKEQSNFGCSFW